MENLNNIITKKTKKEMNRILSTNDSKRNEPQRNKPKLKPYKRSNVDFRDYLDEEEV